LAARVQVLEHRIYPMAVRWYCAGRLRYREGHAWLDDEKLAGPIIYSGAEDR
jgi:phosphoribosylglycinamide formyltransferase-1